MTEAGFKRQYVASRAETINSIKKLLQRRKDFMAARGLHDGASQPVGGRYLFTQQDRQQVMNEWKEEFHAAPEQVEQQKRDSWKPQGRPVGGDWGPNTAAVRNGKHSRFARHLQLEAGSKARTSGSPLETPHVRTPHFHTHPLHTPPHPSSPHTSSPHSSPPHLPPFPHRSPPPSPPHPSLFKSTPLTSTHLDPTPLHTTPPTQLHISPVHRPSSGHP